MGDERYSSVKLDRERHVGTTGGSPVQHGDQVATFCQDGFYFDAQGDLIVGMLTPADKKKLDEIEAQEKARETAMSTFRENLAKQGYDPDSVEISVVPRKLEPVADGVDLEGWAAGTVKMPWSRVRDALKKEHGFVATTQEAARKFLKESGTGFEKKKKSEAE